MTRDKSFVLRINGLAVFACAVWVMVIAASAQVTTTFQSDGGDWNAPANWDNGVPGTNDTAVIGNGLTAVLDGAAAGVNVLTLGDASGAGSLILSNAVFSASIQTADVGMVAGTTGMLIQAGGTITNVYMRVGNVAGATGIYTMNGGTNVVNVVGHFGANGGHGILNMNGGQLSIQGGNKADVLFGGSPGSCFEATIAGGSLLVSKDSDAYVGHKDNVAGDTGVATVHLSNGSLMQAKSYIFGKVQVFMEDAAIDTAYSNNSIYFHAFDKTNSIEMVGGAAFCKAAKEIKFGSNTTVRVVLDETCATDTTYFRTTGVGNARVSLISGTLRVARKRDCYNVPSSVVLFSSAQGGFSNEFQRVVWEDGLTGTVTYDTTAREIRIENIAVPRGGTLIRVF